MPPVAFMGDGAAASLYRDMQPAANAASSNKPIGCPCLIQPSLSAAATPEQRAAAAEPYINCEGGAEAVLFWPSAQVSASFGGMSSPDDLRATRTRPFASTIAAGTGDDTSSGPRSSEVAVLPVQGDIVGMHYRLVRPLGEGNFGKVWVAERLDVPEHRVAMKVLPRSHYAGRNVERELVMLATISHPNVVQLKDHGIEAEFIWLTMPVYVGETLAERLEREPLGFHEAHEIFLPIARAIEALHDLGLRHQDIKPDNIFLTRFGGRVHPVLLDLGVAAEKDSTFVAGTALYAAPEQLSAILGLDKETALSERMDTYCFAATLLEALVGQKHFPGAKALTRKQVIESHEVRASTPVAEAALLDQSETIRATLTERLCRWMALEPAERPSMSEVADQLDILLEPEREAERAEQAARNRQRRSLSRARVLASLVLLAGVGVGALALWKRETLRLASQLEEARAQGAESFDQLDTCVASHAVTSHEAKTCKTELVEEQAEHEKTLTALSKQGEGCAETVDQIKDLRAKLQAEKKKHDDDVVAANAVCKTEKDKLATDLGAERDKHKTERDTCESGSKEKDTLLTQLRQERDTCVAAQAAATNVAASPGPSVDPYADPPPPSGPLPGPEPTTPNHPPPEPPPTPAPTVAPPPPPVAPPAPTTPASQSAGPLPSPSPLPPTVSEPSES
jgi:serine/threonine protein kinase